ncbi:hypothetical protein ABFT98_05370 [Xanthomonas campestris pv. raphani]|uniref:hypothetical protein n=1 Tax=Xanthomonas campestris TaxID=339 RepID=UPI00388E558F
MTNFVFARRDLQKRIDRIKRVLSEDQIIEIVNRLNTPGWNRLPAMWEVVVLDAFSQAAKLKHEVPLPSGRRPDLDLSYSSPNGEVLLVIGDILAVSDKGLDEQNPVNVLFETVPEIARKHGVDPVKLAYKIEGERIGRYGDARMQLSLPKRGDLIKLIYSDVAEWLQRVRQAPEDEHIYKPVGENLNFSISYDPKASSAISNYVSYGVAASREKNPLYKALKAKKEQLDAAPKLSLKLLVACDGDSTLLHDISSSMRVPGNYSAVQIVDHFLSKHSGIDAVVLISVEERRNFPSPKTHRKLRFEIRVKDLGLPGDAISKRCALLDELIREAMKHFPPPQRAPYNAIRRCLEPGVGHSQMGAYQFSDKGHNVSKISISSRGLMGLLSGTMTQEEFINAHERPGSQNIASLFSDALTQGRMIVGIEMEEMDGLDDDYFTIYFGDADAAISPFRI